MAGSAGRLSDDQVESIAEIFADLSYGCSNESEEILKQWLRKRKSGFFIDGAIVCPDGHKTETVYNPITREVLTELLLPKEDDINKAVEAASKASHSWSSVSGHERARHLYNIARSLQKHQQLLAVVEMTNAGKTSTKVRNIDVPSLIRSVYYYAGWAELKETEMQKWKPCGVVAVVTEEFNNPLMVLRWRILAAMAMGNAVILMPHVECSLSALLFAEICASSGLPPGVLNVIPSHTEGYEWLVTHKDIDKVVFTGTPEIGNKIRLLSAEKWTHFSLEVGGRPTVIVLDSADMHSAAEGVAETIIFNDSRTHSAGCRVLVQENIQEEFVTKLVASFNKLRVGSNKDRNCDLTGFVGSDKLQKIKNNVENAIQEGAKIFQRGIMELNICPPAVVTNIQTSSRIVVEEPGGSLALVIPFRTAKEAIQLCNNNIYGLSVSIWSEKLPLALEVAHYVKSGNVWINCQNMYDSAAGFGGLRQSGHGRIGGKESLFDYVCPIWHPQKKLFTDDNFNDDICSFHDVPAIQNQTKDIPLLDHTYKLYYGGNQKRSDSNCSFPVINHENNVAAYVSDANRKDVRSAVEAACTAQAGWEKRSGHNRAQILYFIAENLELRKYEFCHRIQELTGESLNNSMEEVNISIERLFHWAAYCDKYGGDIQETELYGKVLRVNDAAGVIGIVCPINYPLLAFVSLFAPAIARGNTVVIFPSAKHPLPALDLCQVFATSDLPSGVVNVLTTRGKNAPLFLAEHQDIQAIWCDSHLSAKVAITASYNFKHVWPGSTSRNWKSNGEGKGEEFLYHGTHFKNIWLPMGDVFAN